MLPKHRLTVDSQAGCASPSAGVSFGAPLPAEGGGGELQSHPVKVLSLKHSHTTTHRHTHTQQLSTGKAGDRMRSPFTATLVRRGVQMGSCYTLIVG